MLKIVKKPWGLVLMTLTVTLTVAIIGSSALRAPKRVKPATKEGAKAIIIKSLKCGEKGALKLLAFNNYDDLKNVRVEFNVGNASQVKKTFTTVHDWEYQTTRQVSIKLNKPPTDYDVCYVRFYSLPGGTMLESTYLPLRK